MGTNRDPDNLNRIAKKPAKAGFFVPVCFPSAPLGGQQDPLPVARHLALRAGRRLVDGVAVGRSEYGAANFRVDQIAVEPVFAWLETLDDGMARVVRVLRGMLAERVVAAADVAALRTAAEVESPAVLFGQAFDAAGAARRDVRTDAGSGFVLHAFILRSSGQSNRPARCRAAACMRSTEVASERKAIRSSRELGHPRASRDSMRSAASATCRCACSRAWRAT